MEKDRMNDRMHSRGGNLFFDVRMDRSVPYLKITQSKPLGNGHYRRETIYIERFELLEFRNIIDEMAQCWDLVPKKKYSLDEVRKQYGNAYLPWTDEADAYLVRLYKEGKSVKELSEIFERAEGAIRSRLMKLGEI